MLLAIQNRSAIGQDLRACFTQVDRRKVTNTGANESGSAAKKFIGVDNVEQ